MEQERGESNAGESFGPTGSQDPELKWVLQKLTAAPAIEHHSFQLLRWVGPELARGQKAQVRKRTANPAATGHLKRQALMGRLPAREAVQQIRLRKPTLPLYRRPCQPPRVRHLLPYPREVHGRQQGSPCQPPRGEGADGGAYAVQAGATFKPKAVRDVPQLQLPADKRQPED